MKEPLNIPTTRIVLTAAVGAIAIAGAAAWLWRCYGPSTYKRFDTMFGKARVYQVADDEGSPVRLLEVGGIVHSGTYLDERYDELVFEYLKRYDIMFESNHLVKNVLVLGCGGYDYPKHLIAHHPEVSVDAVEIDPTITAIAQRFFFLDRVIEEHDAITTRHLNIICDDALEHLRKTDRAYDAVVNDTFDAGTPPAHLTTAEFAQTVHDHLADGGMYLTNIVSPLKGPGTTFLDEQVNILQTVFGDVRVIPCATDSLTEADNVIVVCSKHMVR